MVAFSPEDDPMNSFLLDIASENVREEKAATCGARMSQLWLVRGCRFTNFAILFFRAVQRTAI